MAQADDGALKRCLNCACALPAAARFCAQCGQKSGTARLQVRDIGHDLWHALTHTDHSVLGLIKALLLRPGEVARDYVQGRRKRWFNPFTFLIVLVGLATVAMVASDFVQFGSRDPVSSFLQRHLNLLILLQVPLLAGFARLLFARSEHNYAEELVLAAYTSGLRAVGFTLLIAPGWLLLQRFQVPLAYPALVGAYLVVWVLYFGWACAQFHAPQWRWGALLRGVMVALLTQASVMLVVALAITAARVAKAA